MATAVARLPMIEREMASGCDVVRAGDVVPEIHLVVDGMVGRCHQDAEGHRQTTGMFLPGDIANLHALVLPATHASLMALGRARVARISRAALLDVTRRFPAFGEACWRECSIDAHRASRWVFVMGRLKATSRVAHLLCEAALRLDTIGNNRSEFSFLPNQAQIGDMLGLTAVHVNRTIRQLRERGIAEIRDRIALIKDWTALVQIAQFDDRYLCLAG